MSNQSNFVINDVKKGRRCYPLKDCDWDQPSMDIQMLGSSGDRGVNPPKMEFFDVVAHLESGLA
jgi:hypothetical protein